MHCFDFDLEIYRFMRAEERSATRATDFAVR
jgi:hypothetical protein